MISTTNIDRLCHITFYIFQFDNIIGRSSVLLMLEMKVFLTSVGHVMRRNDKNLNNGDYFVSIDKRYFSMSDFQEM